MNGDRLLEASGRDRQAQIQGETKVINRSTGNWKSGRVAVKLADCNAALNGHFSLD